MQTDLQISYKDMKPPRGLEDYIRNRAAKLEAFHDRITGCHVRIEAPHTRAFHGQVYHVRIDVIVPGREIVINREPGRDPAHRDVHLAVRDAFDAAERRIEDHARRQDPYRVKPHPAKLTGKVVRLDDEAACGAIRDAAGREFYFSRTAVNVPWESLSVGTEVRFTEHEGDEGPCAGTVTPV